MSALELPNVDENMGLATPNFFNSAWNPDQGDFPFTDNYQGNIESYDELPQNQNYHMGNGNNDQTDYFSVQPGQQFQQGYHPTFPQDSSNDEIARILTPGLSFLSMDVGPEIETLSGTESFPTFGQAPQMQGMQPCAPASLAFGSEGMEAFSLNSWSSVVKPQASGATFLNNSTDRETALIHGQITPGDSPPSEDEMSGLKNSTTSPPIEQVAARSTRGKLATTAKLDAPSVNDEFQTKPIKKPRKSKKKLITKDQEELKRKRFLERNRVAADKCRQNRKKWVDDLQEKCHKFSTDNAIKKAALEEMEQEILQLKNMLFMHSQGCKDENISAWVERETNKTAISVLAKQGHEDAEENLIVGASPSSQPSSS